MSTRPGRLLLVVATSTGGVGNHVRAVAAGLVTRGDLVRIAAPAQTVARFAFADTGALVRTVQITDRPRPRADTLAVAALRRLAVGADVVHAHGLRAGALAALALTGRRGDPPLVVTVHNAAPEGPMTRPPYGVLERVVAARADLVLTVSADLADRMRRLGARAVEHAHVPAPPGQPRERDAAHVRRELGAGDRPLVLTVARLAAQKGLPLLLDAALLLAAPCAAGPDSLGPPSRPPLFAVAGDGPLRDELADRIEREDLPVRLLGRRTDVADLLGAADVFVLPSLWEGQPLVLQEALRAGVPIVATDVGGVREVVGDAAVLVPSGDAPALTRAVTGVLTDTHTASALRERALRRASRLPTEADVITQLTTAYDRVRRVPPHEEAGGGQPDDAGAGNRVDTGG
jgi:glycosyltransferase involved in cell wall biosynthesis